MIDNYSLVMLIKHYAWQALYQDKKPILATNLLEAAYEIARDHISDNGDLFRQLRRDIAEQNLVHSNKDIATKELIEIGDGFRVGDYYLKEGRYREALKIYKDFQKTGRFNNGWRLWKCSFLLGMYRDSLRYFEHESVAVIPRYRINALAIASVKEFDPLIEQNNWDNFQREFPKTAGILISRLGNPLVIEQTGKRWMSTSNIKKIRIRLKGKKSKSTPDEFDKEEFSEILKKAYLGIAPEYHEPTPTATSILKTLSQSNQKLDGKTVVEYMSIGYINNVIIDNHKNELISIIDVLLYEFEEKYQKDIISYYKSIVLGNFGFYEHNEASNSLKSILFEADNQIRLENNLPARGEGWLSEAEMVRLLRSKFEPHEVITQHSPKWLQNMRFDAFIPDFRLAVEYQGEQHYHPVDFFGGVEGFAENVERDTFKLNLSKENGVIIEYISYKQDIDKETTKIVNKFLGKKPS